jgi:hypothetical protein
MKRWPVPWIAGSGGLACLGLSFGLAGNPTELASAYLVACLFFLSLGLGGLFFVLVQFVTRAGWSVSLRRSAEHVMATIPVLGLLLVPLGAHLGSLYPWARGEAPDVALPDWQEAYFAPPFFSAPAFSYVLVWAIVAWWFRQLSLKQDETRDPEVTRRLQRASAPALILYAISVSFAAFDWIMSLESGWYSTIFGVYFFAGCVVGFLALLAVALALPPDGLSSDAVGPGHLHDVGKLLFGFVAFWAYIAFSQYLLIWYAGVPEETVFYGRRLGPGWIGLTRLLAAGHFVLPFFFLLAADVKRKGVTLAVAGLWLLAMHYLDLYWLVMPAVRGVRAVPRWVDLSTAVGVGLVFLAALGVLMRRGAPIPMGDPRLPESLAPEQV